MGYCKNNKNKVKGLKKMRIKYLGINTCSHENTNHERVYIFVKCGSATEVLPLQCCPYVGPTVKSTYCSGRGEGCRLSRASIMADEDEKAEDGESEGVEEEEDSDEESEEEDDEDDEELLTAGSVPPFTPAHRDFESKF